MVVFVLDHSLDLLSNRFEFFVDFFLPFFLLIFELENLELLINVRWCGATGTWGGGWLEHPGESLDVDDFLKVRSGRIEHKIYSN